MGVPLQVLFVEDSEDDAELVVLQLRAAGFEPAFQRVDDAESMQAALADSEWDVVLCDYNLPGFSASAALALVQKAQLDLPFLILSGVVSEDEAVSAMKSGAHDYLMKDNLARLVPAIERELREVAGRRERRQGDEERKRLESLMSLYLHPKVASMVAENPDLLRLGGEKRDLTVLFTDLRGFTSAAEMLEPELLVDILSEYLEAMTDIVFAYGGLLDKYMGDGIMALWGTPVPLEDHAARACRAAIEMVEKQRELLIGWQDRNLPPLQLGVGINSGPMVVGNLGSSRRFAYTALGDHVNLGARLEQLNKVYGTRILISEHTLAQVGDEFLVRPIDLVRVRGKQTAVEVFELMGLTATSAFLEGWAGQFTQALGAYRARSWEQAFRLFADLESSAPRDVPTRLYVERSLKMLSRPPAADWDGVHLVETLVRGEYPGQ